MGERSRHTPQGTERQEVTGGIIERGGGQEAKHITKVYEALLSGGSKSNREDPPQTRP